MELLYLMYIMSNCCQCLRCHSYSFYHRNQLSKSTSLDSWLALWMLFIDWIVGVTWGCDHCAPCGREWIWVWIPASLSVSLKATIKILLSVSSPTASQSCPTQTWNMMRFYLSQSVEASVKAAMNLCFQPLTILYISKYVYLNNNNSYLHSAFYNTRCF